ncbi:hypothetical protein BDV39DRAFT_184909 [Aspergillus sergii]|uniref:Uncharacterized protein n=1 Tax=Aspergillus sergii TaxID=1034303 RepID=A0A5N6WLW5_9EURO|nr:hypothetical protein BDV39DRAFT_184909 [Aspergillus sergii]
MAPDCRFQNHVTSRWITPGTKTRAGCQHSVCSLATLIGLLGCFELDLRTKRLIRSIAPCHDLMDMA